MRVTADTNLINTRQAIAEMNTIERWAEEGRLELTAPYRLRAETANYPPARAKAAARAELTEPGIVGLSVLDEMHVCGDDTPEFPDVAALLFPSVRVDSLNKRQQNDVLMLMTHIDHRADVFLTSDDAFLRARAALKERFGAVIMTPAEFVEEFKE